jgi:hypothetical protein
MSLTRANEWRGEDAELAGLIKVHSAAEIFPLTALEKLKELWAVVKTDGLRVPASASLFAMDVR